MSSPPHSAAASPSTFLTASTTLPSAALGAGQLTDADIYDTPCFTVVFSPVTRQLYVIDTSDHQDEIVLVRATPLRGARTRDPDRFVSVADGKLLLDESYGDDGRLQLFDLDSGALLAERQSSTNIAASAVSPIFRRRQFAAWGRLAGGSDFLSLCVADCDRRLSGDLAEYNDEDGGHVTGLEWVVLHGALCLVAKSEYAHSITLLTIFTFDGAQLARVAVVTRDSQALPDVDFPTDFTHALGGDGTLVVYSAQGCLVFSISPTWELVPLSRTELDDAEPIFSAHLSPCCRFCVEMRLQGCAVCPVSVIRALAPAASGDDALIRDGSGGGAAFAGNDQLVCALNEIGQTVLCDALSGRQLEVVFADQDASRQQDWRHETLFFAGTNAVLRLGENRIFRYFRGRVVARNDVAAGDAAAARRLSIPASNDRAVLELAGGEQRVFPLPI